jgi:hypothetical protein
MLYSGGVKVTQEFITRRLKSAFELTYGMYVNSMFILDPIKIDLPLFNPWCMEQYDDVSDNVIMRANLSHKQIKLQANDVGHVVCSMYSERLLLQLYEKKPKCTELWNQLKYPDTPKYTGVNDSEIIFKRICQSCQVSDVFWKRVVSSNCNLIKTLASELLEMKKKKKNDLTAQDVYEVAYSHFVQRAVFKQENDGVEIELPAHQKLQPPPSTIKPLKAHSDGNVQGYLQNLVDRWYVINT